MTISKTLHALSDKSRREILELLKKKDMSVTTISKNFSMTLPSLSHHLKILKEVDLLCSQRKGQEIIYSLNLSVFEDVAKMLINIFKK